MKESRDARAAREHRAVLVHEVTHFIDATTTLWGLGYNARKTRSVQQHGANVEHYEQSLMVFMLNSSEIEVHKQFKQTPPPDLNLANKEMHFLLSVEKNYGPLLTVTFHEGKEVVFAVPLSMLALLEANAYANETLSRILDAELLKDERERESVMTEIQTAYETHMRNAGVIEYTLLLQLLNRSSLQFGLAQRMRFMSAIARVALDADALQMSHFAAGLSRILQPTLAAGSTFYDLSRGSSRAVIAFMSIILLDAHFFALDDAGKQLLLTQLNEDPFLVVQHVLKELGYLSRGVREIEQNVSLKTIVQGYLHDKIIIPESLHHNLPLVASKTCADTFDALTLPDAVDKDGKHAFVFGKRIAVNVLKGDLRDKLAFRRIEATVLARTASRFHV